MTTLYCSRCGEQVGELKKGHLKPGTRTICEPCDDSHISQHITPYNIAAHPVFAEMRDLERDINQSFRVPQNRRLSGKACGIK